MVQLFVKGIMVQLFVKGHLQYDGSSHKIANSDPPNFFVSPSKGSMLTFVLEKQQAFLCWSVSIAMVKIYLCSNKSERGR